MNLINISGNTFYIRGGTNTGLYLFDDNSALIIDPGLSGARPNKIIKIDNENNWFEGLYYVYIFIDG